MEDYEKGVDYLQNLNEVDPDKISFIGTSLGAITGIPFCAKDQRIKACISIVGGGSAESSLPRELDCVQTVGDITPRATMLINGHLDFVIPYEAANNLHKNVKEPNEKLWLMADHYLRGIDKPALYTKIANFILAH
jgi:dienelactone hydrolase